MSLPDYIKAWSEKFKAYSDEHFEQMNKSVKPRKPRVIKQIAISEPKPEKIIIEAPITKRDLRQEEQRKIFERNKKHGYVYLMRSGNGYHKIGISKDVDTRLGGLRRQFPLQIEVIHYFACHDYRVVEKLLHEKYSDKQIEYEWFGLSEDDVNSICKLKDYDLG